MFIVLRLKRVLFYENGFPEIYPVSDPVNDGTDTGPESWPPDTVCFALSFIGRVSHTVSRIHTGEYTRDGWLRSEPSDRVQFTCDNNGLYSLFDYKSHGTTVKCERRLVHNSNPLNLNFFVWFILQRGPFPWELSDT